MRMVLSYLVRYKIVGKVGSSNIDHGITVEDHAVCFRDISPEENKPSNCRLRGDYISIYHL